MRCFGIQIFGAALVLLFSSCTSLSSKEPVLEKREGDFKVSVASNGKAVSNFNEQLVHRVTLSPAELKKVFVKPPKDIRLPFTAQKIFDGRGGIKGVKVTNFRANGGSSSFGLEENDIVTAFGRNHAKSPSDFWLLYQELMKESTATVTLERKGQPHKILFFSGKPSESRAS